MHTTITSLIKSAFIALLLTAASTAHAEKSVIVSEPSSPVTIAHYLPRFGSNNIGLMIKHDVEVTASGSQPVDAYSIRVILFDAFNDYVGNWNIYVPETLQVGGSKKSAYFIQQNVSAAFERFGTGAAYVSKVRYRDGTIWEADKDYVLSELQKISPDMLSENLED